MEVSRIDEGLWRWTARHPEWTPADGGADGWGPVVASTFIDTGSEIVVVDPLVPAEEDEAARFWHALDYDVERAGSAAIVVLTTLVHARSARDVAARYGGAVLAPDARRAETLARAPVTGWFRPGDILPAALEVRGTADPDEVVLWHPGHRTLVTGDLLVGGSDGLRLCPESWLAEGITRADLVASLRPLLDLPLERVLTAHGDPVPADGHARLAAALAG